MNYIRIDRDDMVNGPGIRTVLWVSGCENYCDGCHNPETWCFTAGQPFTKNETRSIMSSLNNDYTAGLTITGGDPLNNKNIMEVAEICKIVKHSLPEKTIWVYTGNLFEDYLRSDKNNVCYDILKYIDVIVDGKFDKTLKDSSLLWRGSSNQRLIDVQKSLNKNDIVLFET